MVTSTCQFFCKLATTSLTLLVVTAVSNVLGIEFSLTLFLFFVPIFVQKRWYRWFYILYKTLPRDFRAAVRFTKMNITLYFWERKKMTVAKVFRTFVDKHPEKKCFQFEDTDWTYAQVEDISNKIAHYFKKQGFKKGDTVALLMESRPEYVCVWLGLSKIGVVTALINSNLRKYPLFHSFNVAETKAILYGSEFTEAVKEVYGEMPGVKLYQHNTKESVELLNNSVNLIEALKDVSSDPLPEDIAKCQSKDKVLYVFTSGTTGLPKAAVITQLRVLMMTNAVYNMLALLPDDVIYDPLPLYHTAGGIVGAAQAILSGLTVVIRRKFSASNYWKDCVKYNCTVAQYIGEICRYLLAQPEDPSEKKHKVRRIFGNGLRPQIWQSFTDRFGIKEVGEFYGATEGNSNIVNFEGIPGAVGFKPRYVRNLYPLGLIRYDEITGEPYRNEDGFCVRCEPNEPGIFVGRINRKKAVSDFAGYTDPKATKKKVLENVFRQGDYYFNSGDILVMDELGYFYFKDRTGDTFRWRGENVATSEVEAVISNVVSLLDAVVYGVQIPNTEGKCGMAAVVDTTDTLDLKLLAKGLRQNLPAYACPLFLRVMKQVPLTGTFKLKKVDLQAEGYDITKIKDKLYFYDSKICEFVPLTEELHKAIVEGKLRL